MTTENYPGPGAFRPLRDRLDHSVQDQAAGQPNATLEHGRAHRRPAPRRSKIVSVLGYAALGIGCLVLAVSTFLFVADPAELIRDTLVSRVKQATGRNLVIRGGTEITIFPSIGISMGKVSLSPPPGMKGRATVKMARLDTKLRLMPLLQRRIVVDRLVLSAPVIDLRIDAKGRKSWDFAAAGRIGHGPKRVRVAQAAGGGAGSGPRNDALPPALRDFANGSRNSAAGRTGAGAMGAAGSPLAALDGLSLDDVRIVKGTLRYTDERTGSRHVVKAVNVALSLKDIVSPFVASGDLKWRGRKIKFKSTVQSLKALLEQRPTKLNASVDAPLLKATYSGGLTLAGSIDMDGKATARSPSVRKLAAWLGTVLPAAPGFGPLNLAGWLSVTPDKVFLRKMKLKFDGASASGDIGVEIGRARPLLRANMKLSRLDLNKYLPAARRQAANVTTGSTTRGTRTKGAGSAGAGPRSIDELLGKAGARPGKVPPQVRGYTKRKGAPWSNVPIDMSALGLIDADVRLQLGKLLYKKLKAGRTQLHAKLSGGRLRADLSDIRLYRGRGKAQITVDGRGRALSLSANVKLTGISALPLLRDAAQFDWIDGKGNLDLLVTGRGTSEQQIVASLLGNGSFTFNDGAIVGVNIPQMIRGLQQGRITSLRKGPTQKTDFSKLSATFQITDGIARNSDLQLIGPLLNVTGGGTISLPPRRLDYLIRPKLVASLGTATSGSATSGLAADLAGLEVPLRVSGPWDSPKIAPDLTEITKDPSKIINAARKIRKAFKGKKVDDVLQGLFGKGGTDKAKTLFNQFLR